MQRWNLVLRFVLELACLLGIGVAGWLVTPVLGVAGGIAAAAAWGVFAVPHDPSRNGKAPVPVHGWVRLLVELAVFIGGAAAWLVAGGWAVSMTITAFLVLHHVAAAPRLRWLLRQRAA